MKLHVGKKHPETVDAKEIHVQVHSTDTVDKYILSEIHLQEILESTRTKIIQNKCYAEDLRVELTNFAFDITKIDSKHIIENQSVNFLKKGNLDKFYSHFYGEVVKMNVKTIPSMSSKASTLLLSKLADAIVVDYKNIRRKEESSNNIIPITERELCGLHYIAGYVIHTLFKRIKFGKNRENLESQKLLSIILACKDDGEDHNASTRLVTALSRGGLWLVKPEIQRLLAKVETDFRAFVKLNKRIVNVNELTKKLSYDMEVNSIFTSIVDSCEINVDADVIEKARDLVIELYLNVRIHSYAKDVVERHKREQNKTKHERKALRTELKQYTEKIKDIAT